MSWWRRFFGDRRARQSTPDKLRRATDPTAIDQQLVEEAEGLADDLHDTADKMKAISPETLEAHRLTIDPD